MELSIVIPVYNEEEIIFELDKRLKHLFYLLNENFKIISTNIEVIFVNDGSTDNSLPILLAIQKENISYKVLDFSRNFGHQIAITAGLEYAKGKAVVIIDADLQDPPEFIVQLYEKFLEGYEVVSCIRKSREGEGIFKIWTAKFFYRIINLLTNINIPLDTGDFRLMSARVVSVLNNMKEKNRFVRGMSAWVGFKQIGLEYQRNERFAGHTKYPLKEMIKFTIDAITSFSSAPLRLVTFLGFFFSFFGFIGALLIIYFRFFTNTTISGWSSIMLTILIMGGINLITLGVLGEYIGRISEETKNRPLYIVDQYYEANITNYE